MPPKRSEFACFCNRVSVAELRDWLKSPQNKKSLPAIQDATSAGCGPCGGSCRPLIVQLIQESLQKTPNSAQQAQIPLPNDFVKAISLFNRRYYWETHEVLEELWLEETGKTRTSYQAIIQGAAALYHVLNANPRGVIKLSQDSLAKFEGPTENPWQIDLSPLISALKSYKTQAEEILGKTRSGFDYSELPRIQLDQHLQVGLT